MPRKQPSFDGRPRGRMTAYAFFVQMCQEDHKKRHPGQTLILNEFNRRCAEHWKSIDDKEKKKFNDLAYKDRKRFENEMKLYFSAGKGTSTVQKRKPKDPEAPKRSLTAFFWFCKEQRQAIKEQNPAFGVGDVAKEVGKMWATVDARTRREYEQKAIDDKARYDQEMAAYKQGKAAAAKRQKMLEQGEDEEHEHTEEQDQQEQEYIEEHEGQNYEEVQYIHLEQLEGEEQEMELEQIQHQMDENEHDVEHVHHGEEGVEQYEQEQEVEYGEEHEVEHGEGEEGSHEAAENEQHSVQEEGDHETHEFVEIEHVAEGMEEVEHVTHEIGDDQHDSHEAHNPLEVDEEGENQEIEYGGEEGLIIDQAELEIGQEDDAQDQGIECDIEETQVVGQIDLEIGQQDEENGDADDEELEQTQVVEHVDSFVIEPESADQRYRADLGEDTDPHDGTSSDALQINAAEEVQQNGHDDDDGDEEDEHDLSLRASRLWSANRLKLRAFIFN